MDRLFRGLSLAQNSGSNNKDSKKNKEIMVSKIFEKSLENWKLPPCSPSDFFKRSGIFNFSPDRTVRTVEKEIVLSEEYASFPLFTENLQRVYYDGGYLHIGMIQVGLKPTKLGSNTSAIICLRDKRRPKFHKSLFAMVESSLCDGPIYFSYQPTGFVVLSHPQISSSFSIDIKTQRCGSSDGAGDANIVLMYRCHYKLMDITHPSPVKRTPGGVDLEGETTVFLSNDVGRSNRVVSKRIYWDQVSVPERWMDENNPSTAGGEEGEVARIDWKEVAEAYALKVDLPGFKKEEVRVEMEAAGRVLIISGERRLNEQEDGNGKWRCIERSSGKFLRRLRLPEDAKMNDGVVDMENGVLTVTVPKEKRDAKLVHMSA
ncbi:hypothetical protein OROHE_009568 [Orobanche hederae]